MTVKVHNLYHYVKDGDFWDSFHHIGTFVTPYQATEAARAYASEPGRNDPERPFTELIFDTRENPEKGTGKEWAERHPDHDYLCETVTLTFWELG